MLTYRFALAALGLPALCLSAATAAKAETREDGQVWLQTVGQGSISGDIVYFAELQSRFGDTSQVLIRPAIGVNLSNKVTVYQGYAYVPTTAVGRRETREHRSFQQVNWSLGKPGGVALSSRTRLEQRWLSSGDDVGLRLRQMIRAAVPVKGKVAALGWVEGFAALNDTDWGARSGLDRVRTFAGLEVPLAGKSTVEVGYLNQYINTATGPNQMDHVAAINLMLRQ